MRPGASSWVNAGAERMFGYTRERSWSEPRGTGLGLFISYGIIQEHQGTVDVQSAPGRGTTFVLTFPLPPTD